MNSVIEMTGTTELAHRSADGIDVVLLWDSEVGHLWVAVEDARTGETFELSAAGGSEALELFYHPFAHLRTGG